MKTRGWRIEHGGWRARSVLECGSPLPLSIRQLVDSCHSQSARGLAQSKTWRQLVVALFCFCLLPFAFCLRASGQNYSIDWHKIAGGGGTSSNAQYTVSGTIGQPDAGGPMAGGNYSLTGGFWALISVVQTPGAPTLTIVPAGPGQATISWVPATGTNWVLQETPSLSPTNWINSPSGTTNPIVVPATPPTKFYRLFKP